MSLRINKKPTLILYRLMKNKKIFILLIIAMAGLFVSCDQNHHDNHEKLINCNKEIAVTVVHNLAVGLSNVLKDISDSAMRVEIAQKLVDSVRFYKDGSGYFYIDTFDGWNIAHDTTQEMQGKNYWDYQDARGTYVFRELTKLAKSGGGFLEYYWFDPATQKQEKKLGYVETVPGTNWYIGDGVYLNRIGP